MASKKNTKKKSAKTAELGETFLVLRVPKDTVRIDLKATVLQDDSSLLKVSRKFGPGEIAQMRSDFLIMSPAENEGFLPFEL